MNKLTYIFSLIICSLVTIAGYGSYQSHDYSMSTENPEPKIEYVYIEKEPEVVYVYIPFEEVGFRNISTDNEWYYKDIGMREAEGEGVIGMLWVMYTFDCRCRAFNHTPEEEWKSSAYTSMSRSGITPNEDCEKAFELFREGWIPEPLYFRAGTYHSFGTELCQVGNHYFSTK